MSFYTYNLKNFVNLHTFSSLYANFRRAGTEQLLKTLQNYPLQRLFIFGIVLTFSKNTIIIYNTKVSASTDNEFKFRKDCELCTTSNIIRRYSISTAG